MSSKLSSLQRRNLVLGLLAVVLGAWVLLRPEPVTSARKEALPFVFPDFARDDARRVEFLAPARNDEPEKRLVIEMHGPGEWRLESHYRYPLQAGADRLLDAIGAARLRGVVTERQETFETYADDTGWTEVAVVDSRGRTLVQFGLGRYQYPDTFLRLGTGGAARIVKATNVVPNMASVDPKTWIDTRVWPDLSSTKAIRIDVEQRRDARTITIVKRGESAADLEMGAPEADPAGEKIWWLASPVEGDAKKLAVEDLAREFTGMLIDDIVAGSLTKEDERKYGFDDPELVATLYHKEGDKVSKHKLTVGRQDEASGGWYVRRSGSSWVFAISGGTGINRMRQAPEEFLEPPPGADEPEGGEGGEGAEEAPGVGIGDPDGDGGDAPKDDPKKDAPEDDAPKDPAPPQDEGSPKKDEPKERPKKDEPDEDEAPKKDAPGEQPREDD